MTTIQAAQAEGENMNQEKEETDNNEDAPEPEMTERQKVAHGIMWFLIWLGFGGCCYLSNQSGPIVSVVRSVDQGEK